LGEVHEDARSGLVWKLGYLIYVTYWGCAQVRVSLEKLIFETLTLDRNDELWHNRENLLGSTLGQ